MVSSVSYEVMVFKNGHWSIAFITDSEEEALSEAKSAVAGRHAQAVKVIQETTDDQTGDERSKIIYNSETHGATAAHPAKAGQKHDAHGASKVAAPHGGGKSLLHPELVTNFIDRIRMSIIVFGAIGFVILILMYLYVTNPDIASKLLNIFFK